MSLFFKKNFPASTNADGDDMSAIKILGLPSAPACLITKTWDADDVFVFRPLTSPKASANVIGISVMNNLEGFVTSPSKKTFCELNRAIVKST